MKVINCIEHEVDSSVGSEGLDCKEPVVIRKQRGVTLIEIVVYMAIALIFIALAGGRIFDAFSSQGAQTETDNIISLISATKETRGRAGYGTNASASLIPTLDSLERIPNALAVNSAGTVITNSWNGTVTVFPVGTSALNSFTVSSALIPKAACIKMVQRLSETGLVERTAGTKTVLPADHPISSVDAVAVCGTDTNTITWTIKG